jgi:tRNA(Ile)-lysidine synthase
VARRPDDAQVTRFGKDLDQLAPTGHIALGVSGGPDSLALLLLATTARPGRVVAATVDHGLRPESADEAAMVADVCRQLSVPHRIARVTVTNTGEGLQAAARSARYAALSSWARNEGAQWLATAHHLDDQAETVLMRLARGSGVTGLSGIRALRRMGRSLSLVRPLLGWRKTELIEIVERTGLVPVDDPSNTDPRFDRSRARALLAGGWPPSDRLAAVAARLAEADAALDWQVARLAQDRLTLSERSGKLDASGIPRELRRRLLLMAITALVPGREPRGDELDRLLDRLDGGNTSTLGGVRIQAGRPWLLSIAPPHRSV